MKMNEEIEEWEGYWEMRDHFTEMREEELVIESLVILGHPKYQKTPYTKMVISVCNKWLLIEKMSFRQRFALINHCAFAHSDSPKSVNIME